MTRLQTALRRIPSLAGRIGGICFLLLLLGAPSVSQAQLSEILVEANVPNATVVVDGQEMAQTNAEGLAYIEALAPGQHSVELRKTGYWNASVRVSLEPGLTTPVVLELRRRSASDAGNLLVETNVAGALVSLDGEEVGETGPGGRIFVSGVEPGRHRIVVQKEGYGSASSMVLYDETGLDQTKELRLARGTGGTEASEEENEEGTITAGAGVPDSVAASFPSMGGTATDMPALIVDAAVAGATVRVNDSVRGRTGRTGQLRVPVDTGRYQVAVSKDGLPSSEATVDVNAGEERTLRLNLQKDGPAGPTGIILFLVLSLLGLSTIVAVFVVVISGTGGPVVRWLQEKLGVTRRMQYRLARWVRHPFQDRKPFDRYYLIRELRSGEFATVYLADAPERRQRVRLRILDDPYAGDPDHAESFLEGGRILQHLREAEPDSPIVTAYRCGRENGTADGRPFLALEYFRGRTLVTHMKGRGNLDVDPALAIVRQICVGLRAAHESGISHGHLTPANVIVTQEDPLPQIKLAGFGDRGHKYTTQILTDGYPGSATSYLSPEKFEDGRGTWQSDMYALGMLFYKMLTGTPPFIHENPVRIVEMHEEEEPPELPERVPPTIKPVFYRMVSKDPERRPTAKKVISVLDLIQIGAKGWERRGAES